MAFIYPFVRYGETLTSAILIGTTEGKHQTQNLIKYSTAIKPNYINCSIVNAATWSANGIFHVMRKHFPNKIIEAMAVRSRYMCMCEARQPFRPLIIPTRWHNSISTAQFPFITDTANATSVICVLFIRVADHFAHALVVLSRDAHRAGPSHSDRRHDRPSDRDRRQSMSTLSMDRYSVSILKAISRIKHSAK